jgi:polyphosphate kinase
MAKKTKDYLINREISWLSFNERVLQEAADKTVPLLERIKFLGIYSNNLDEFFRVRYATIKRIVKYKIETDSVLGGTPKQILNQIKKITSHQRKKFLNTYSQIVSELKKENIYIVNEKMLTKEQGDFVKQFFREKVKARLTPLMLDPENPFPLLSDNHIYLAVKCSYKKSDIANLKPSYAILDVPTNVCPRFVILPKENGINYVMFLEDVIRYNFKEIFNLFSYDKYEAYCIKVTRDAELDLDFDYGINSRFISKLSKSIKKRSIAMPVRFTYDQKIPADMLNFLKKKINFSELDSMAPSTRYHNFKDFSKFPDFGMKSLKYKKVPPVYHRLLKPNTNFFDILKTNDALVHLPYQTFNHVTDLLRQAAVDPKVREIQIVLYRVARDSAVADALINAVRNGKRVTVVVELQARFDEARNIYFAEQLSNQGARVIYGAKGLKVHCKLVLISRQEKSGLAYYANIGTGNFNEETSKIYGDESFFTADTRITNDVIKVFDYLKDNSKKPKCSNLIVSPFNLRKSMLKMIDEEIKNAKKDKDSGIFLKLNGLIDYEIIDRLYKASCAGVKIKLIVRGICALVPQVKGLSENIEVISLIDKYLEHARIYGFANGGEWKYYISSADWMTRNFDQRIEVACPIYDDLLKAEIRDILDIQFSDNMKTRIVDGKAKNEYKNKKARNKVRAQFEIYDYLRRIHKA